MKLEKFHKLAEIMASGLYYVDFSAGEIMSVKLKRPIGTMEKKHKKVRFWVNEKKYTYTAAEVIMAQLGHITVENCEAVVVENLSGNGKNTKINNLRVLTKSDYVRVRHMKGNCNWKGIIPYQQKAIDEDKRQDILTMKSMGFYHVQIAEVLGMNKHTVQWYYYGYDKKYGNRRTDDKRMVRKTQRRKTD